MNAKPLRCSRLAAAASQPIAEINRDLEFLVISRIGGSGYYVTGTAKSLLPVIELASPKNNSLLSSAWLSANYSSLSVFFLFVPPFFFSVPACGSSLITGELSERCSSVALHLCCHRNSHSFPGG